MSKHKKNTALSIILRIYQQGIKATPFSAVIAPVYYILQGLLPAVTAYILAQFLDAAAKGESLWGYGILFISIYAAVNILQWGSGVAINAGVYERYTSYAKRRISEKTAALPLLAFEDERVFNLQNRALECVNRDMLSQTYMILIVIITNGISVVSTIGVLAIYSPYFVPISLFSVLPYLIARIIRGKEFYHMKKAQSKKTRRMNYLWSLFQNRQTVKEMRVMGFDGYLAKQYETVRDEINEEVWQHNRKESASMFFCDALKIIGYGVSVLIALSLTMKGAISIGVFGACIAAFKSVQEKAKDFLYDAGHLPEKMAFGRDYFDYLDLDEEHSGDQELTGPLNAVSLSGVSFRYPGSETDALHEVSLTIHRGEKIVVLGVNGSGKTTLSKILLGLYPPAEGTVLYNEQDGQNLKKSSLYSRLSVVPQNFTSYHLSLRENIAMSDLSRLSDDEALGQSLAMAGLPALRAEVGGLDVQLGREFGGAEFSGGQWQKMAIARGLFRDSELVVLDEPTSALDPLVETEILQQFLQAAKDRTAVIISHRTGLCKAADRIVVMKEGQICEVGSHEALMARGGEYAKMYQMQAEWYQ